MKKKDTYLYFIPLGFVDEDNIKKSTKSKIASGEAITGYLLTKEELAEKARDDTFYEEETKFYKFKLAGKVTRKIKITFKE